MLYINIIINLFVAYIDFPLNNGDMQENIIAAIKLILYSFADYAIDDRDRCI